MSSRAWGLLYRVVRRRLAEGESLEEVLLDYTKLTEDERERLRSAMA